MTGLATPSGPGPAASVLVATAPGQMEPTGTLRSLMKVYCIQMFLKCFLSDINTVLQNSNFFVDHQAREF